MTTAMPILNYSFPLPPPAPAAQRDYAFSEFMLGLPARWRRMAGEDGDDSVYFQSDDDGAVIIISADFTAMPDDQAEAVAETCLRSRIDALEAANPGRLRVLQQAIKPHAAGVGLEMSFVVEVEGEHVHLFLGYVTPRKILGFSMVCQPGRHEAVALFNATVPGFRPRLP